MAVAGAVALISGRVQARGGSCPLGVAMAIVLVAVLILAGSIWIAIRMEAGLDRPPVTRDGGPGRGLRSCELRCAGTPVGHAYPVRPARCQLQHSVANHGTA